MFQILPNECGISLNHNIQALAAEKFAACGKIIALGLLQGSEAPHCFCKEVSDFLVYGAIKDPECAYMLKSIPDSELSGKLNQVSIEEIYSMQIYPKYYNSFTTTFIFLSYMPVRMMQEFNNCSRMPIFHLYSIANIVLLFPSATGWRSSDQCGSIVPSTAFMLNSCRCVMVSDPLWNFSYC